MRYVYASGMGGNPASVEMDTGTVRLNAELWDELPVFVKKFILKHEEGHYKLATDSEEEADYYALKKLYKTEPASLKKIIEALAYFLPDDNERVRELYIKALEIDYSLNGNEKAKTTLEKMRIKTTSYDNVFTNPVQDLIPATGDNAPVAAIPSEEKQVQSKSGKKRVTIQFMGYEVSLTEIFLFAICFILILKRN